MSATQQFPYSNPTNTDDLRPRLGIGHVALPATDVNAQTDFYTKIGMRLVVNMGRASILELRGGTHIVIQSGGSKKVSLDFIVDDIDETQAVLKAAGADTGPITRGHPHDRFIATDPEGNTLVVNSNHAIGPV